MKQQWAIAAVAVLAAGLPKLQGQSNSEAACLELNQEVLKQMGGGSLSQAEKVLQTHLSSSRGQLGSDCEGQILYNMAATLNSNGRLREAELLAGRSLGILEASLPANHPLLLRPLQVLAAVWFEQGQMAKARQMVQRMASIDQTPSGDHSLTDHMTASLLHAAGRLKEAEAGYLEVISALQVAGRDGSTDVGSILCSLASIYIQDGRLEMAGQSLDRAQAIFASANGAVPWDLINLLHARAVLKARLSNWRGAEADLQQAIAMAEREPDLDRAEVARLFVKYAQVLRKNHKGRQARVVEARTSALRGGYDVTKAVVDVTELMGESRK